MAGKPYQSILIPYEDEIFMLRRQRPPVAFAAISELLQEKYQISIQRAAICKFVNVRARWRKKQAREIQLAARTCQPTSARGSQPQSALTRPSKDTMPPKTAEAEHRRPWHGWQKDKPASTGRLLTTFTPSNEYNLTRLTPEEAAAYIEQLKREREENGG